MQQHQGLSPGPFQVLWEEGRAVAIAAPVALCSLAKSFFSSVKQVLFEYEDGHGKLKVLLDKHEKLPFLSCAVYFE